MLALSVMQNLIRITSLHIISGKLTTWINSGVLSNTWNQLNKQVVLRNMKLEGRL